jgi:mannose-1-phosphate guanylyltransferase/phosphomannomutase
MKAVLLAAGKGDRLGEMTRVTPKVMIPINGKPLIEWNIGLCKQHGITDIYINLYHLPRIVTDYLGNGERFGVTLTYAHEAKLMGTGGGVKQFSKSLQEAPFFVIYADNWSDFDLKLIRQHHKTTGAEMTIALFHLEDVHLSGVAVLDQEDRILKFFEKPKTDPPPSHWVNAGIYLMEPHLLSRIPVGTCDFGREVIPRWIQDGVHVAGIKMKKKVIPIDTPGLLKKAKIRKQ